jgi:hypothetical protein
MIQAIQFSSFLRAINHIPSIANEVVVASQKGTSLSVKLMSTKTKIPKLPARIATE